MLFNDKDVNIRNSKNLDREGQGEMLVYEEIKDIVVFYERND